MPCNTLNYYSVVTCLCCYDAPLKIKGAQLYTVLMNVVIPILCYNAVLWPRSYLF